MRIRLLNFSKSKVLLALIIFLFLLTRLYKITEIPPSLYWDEASIGYNAYSISQTEKDEWGEVFPLHFRAFGEFKLPVFIYAVAIFIKIFGFNEFSVRLPAVLFSLISIILVYLLGEKISNKKEIGLFGAFFLSISPWFFIFSRTGYEATSGIMFYLLAIYLFLFNSKKYFYILFSILSFILSAYSYNSFRIIIPLTFLILILFEIKNLSREIKRLIIPIVISILLFFLSIIPIYRLYIYDAGFSRLQAVGVQRWQDIVNNYLSHFNPDFLFNGDKNLRSQQPGFGQIYLPDLILFVIGFIYIIRNKQKIKKLPLLLLLGPIPASLTRESPHALRSLSVVPSIAIISALGVSYISEKIEKRNIFKFGIIIIFLIFFINYFLNFINIYPYKSSKNWQYGYKEVFIKYKDDFFKYDQVIISDKYAQPYIFALFYLKYNPNKFRKEVIRNNIDKWGFSTVASFSNFKFTKIEKEKLLNGKLLIFSSPDERLKDIPQQDIIRNLDQTVAFFVYEYNKK